ncbi:MAG: VC0807 family protein [Bdellovibrionia bacterium]
MQTKPENPFLNILFNVLLPIMILNKGGQYVTPVQALLLALAFPISYGIYDLIQRKKFNYISLLGLLNVLLTGGFAISGLSGSWFALKEAGFPLLVGGFVLASAFTKKPFIETLFLNPQVVKVDLIEEKLKERNLNQEFHAHLKSATLWLASSFLLSAVLNFILAVRIFTPIDSQLPEDQKSALINQQIADMTMWSYPVIMIPSILFLIGIMIYLFRGIRQHTGLTTEEIMQAR